MLIGAGLKRLGWSIGVLASLALGFIFGVFLFFVASGIHSACIESQLCVSGGDRNVGYGFLSFLAFPVYAILLGTFAAGGAQGGGSRDT